MSLIEYFKEFALLGAEWVLWLLVGLSVFSVGVMFERWRFYRRHSYDAVLIQKRLVPFWKQLGFLPREGREGFRFSDYEYVECSRHLAVRHDAINIDSDPYMVMRPEGEWDHENVLDRSAMRPAVA